MGTELEWREGAHGPYSHSTYTLVVEISIINTHTLYLNICIHFFILERKRIGH